MLLDCAAADAIGIVIGSHGNGKTWALRALHKRHPKLLPGTCILYRCCQARGFTRGIRDLFAEMEIGGAIVRNNSSASLQLMIKLAVREFTARQIGCLLLDEADLWNAEALGGMISLYDVCRDKGWSRRRESTDAREHGSEKLGRTKDARITLLAMVPVGTRNSSASASLRICALKSD